MLNDLMVLIDSFWRGARHHVALSLSLILFLWFTHEPRNQTLRKSSSFIFLLSLFFWIPRQWTYMHKFFYKRSWKKRGVKRESVSIWNTCHRGNYYCDVPAELICSGRERESRKYGENSCSLSRRYLYLFTCTAYWNSLRCHGVDALKGYAFSSFFHPNVSQYAQDLSEITLSIEECWTTTC